MIIHGDSLDELKKLEANSIDAVVTDPPYGLGNTSPKNVTECLRAWSEGETWTPSGRGFMGKSWDAWVPPPELWREVFRVLKHGGHALVFAGSRTQDLMSISLRLAGFEVRDSLQWLYGSGFPKSHNVSKGIDKQRYDKAEVYEVTAWIRETRDKKGLSNRDIDDFFGFNGMAGHWTSTKSQPSVPPLDQVPKLLEVLGVAWGEIPERIRYLLQELNSPKGQPAPTWFEREVIGEARCGVTAGLGAVNVENVATNSGAYDLTAPASPEAEQWEGWGTALKPAYEPVILVRKPLQGTVAQNVLEHGTGALNIDATRIGDESTINACRRYTPSHFGTSVPVTSYYVTGSDKGRWPSNVLLDQESADLLEEQVPKVSRFFYCAKASKAEREAGLAHRDAETRDDGRQTTIDNPYLRGDTERRNTHPTVKPIDLMRYLCRLITPPDGTILDPFTGSGSTLCGAVLEGFNFVGIEREAEYVEIARARVAHYQATLETEDESQEDDQLGLFDNLPTSSPRTDGEG